MGSLPMPSLCTPCRLADVGEAKVMGAPEYAGGGADTHPAAAQGGVGTGYFAKVMNFPGPKYGLPGYKESHNWEDGCLAPCSLIRQACTSHGTSDP